MYSPFVLVAFLSLFTSQVLAFNFNVTVGTDALLPAQLLDIPASPVNDACKSQCSAALTAFSQCQPEDAACFCSDATINPFVNCETCMFHFLIDKNQKPPVPIAGSNVVVGAYGAACGTDKARNITLALTLPETWDGPFVAVLPIGGAVVAVTGAAILGVSALLILSNLN